MTVASMGRQSIPTRYNGQLFRSKLEADWALAFDRLGIAWEYEKEGLQLETLFYLPDFYLPQSRQYFEVKGNPQLADVEKGMALVRASEPRPHTGEWCDDIRFVMGFIDGEFVGFTKVPPSGRHLVLSRCRACDGWWFHDPSQSFICQCCGASDGDHHVRQTIPSPIAGWPRDIRMAD